MNQSFSSDNLLKLLKEVELRYYSLSKSDLRSELDNIFNAIKEDKFEFKINKIEDNFTVNDLAQKLLLRRLNDNIKRIYKDEQSNRRIIISQVKTLLQETSPFWILKTDIKSFYESINNQRLVEKLKDDAMISYHSIYLVKKIFDNILIKKNINGLPRGINVSATLSEIYMRKFDQWARRYQGVFYYARFVDDIIIFTSSEKVAQAIKGQINTILDELDTDLKINDDKTEIFDGLKITKSKPLNYLGYSFFKEKSDTAKVKPYNKSNHIKINNLDITYIDSGIEISLNSISGISKLQYDAIEVAKQDKLIVTIAEKKVQKIKTRIIKAFVYYSQNKDFRLLENRIKFLTSNFPIRQNKETNKELRAGIFYNYNQITSNEVLQNLNTFYLKILFSKNKGLGNKLKTCLSITQKNRLKKYNFLSGFEKPTYHKFKTDEMKEIVNNW